MEDEGDAFEVAVSTFERSERCNALRLFDGEMLESDWVRWW